MQDYRHTASADEWRQGWNLVLACFVGFSFFSVMSASMAVFMVPLGQEFGWSRTLLSAGVAIASGTTAVLSPFVGVLIDRFGSRRVALPGLVATAIAIGSFSLADGSPLQWLALWTFYAIISISVKTTVWTTAVAGAFRSAQGLALGLTLSGIAAAQTISPPLATWLITEFGWRAAYVWLGFGWGGVTLIICFLFLHDARDRGLPSSDGALRDGSPRRPSGLSLSQALRNPALHRTWAATFIMILLTIGLLVHQIEIMIAAGLTAQGAAWIASLAGIAGVTGKLLTGWLLDRYTTTWTGGITMVATAIGFVLLMDQWRSPALLAPAMVICGYSAGTALQIGSYYTAKHAGMANFGAIYGVLTSIVAIGSGVGPLLAGFIYDANGSYTPFLIAGAAGSVVSGMLIRSMPPWPDWVT